MPPLSRMWVSARVSSSSVVMPGRTAATSSSRVRPTSSPAVRMPASCSGVLPSQRSRLNRPMPRNPTARGPRTPASRPSRPGPGPGLTQKFGRHAAIPASRANCCVPVVHSFANGRVGSRAAGVATVAWWSPRLAALVAPRTAFSSSSDGRRVGVTARGPRRSRALGPPGAGPTRGLCPPRGPRRGGRSTSATGSGLVPSCAPGPTKHAASHHAAVLLDGVRTCDVDLRSSTWCHGCAVPRAARSVPHAVPP